MWWRFCVLWDVLGSEKTSMNTLNAWVRTLLYFCGRFMSFSDEHVWPSNNFSHIPECRWSVSHDWKLGRLLCCCCDQSSAPIPPPDVLARGVTWQGISCILTGCWGTGNGTTAYNVRTPWAKIWEMFFQPTCRFCATVTNPQDVNRMEACLRRTVSQSQSNKATWQVHLYLCMSMKVWLLISNQEHSCEGLQ